MKKLKLDLDDLEVESFQTTPDTGDSEEGTVYGYLSFGPGNTCDNGCTGNTACRVCTNQTLCNQNTCQPNCTNHTLCNQNTCNNCPCPTQPAMCGTFACTLPASC
ncbi:MAG: hypothetical protein AAF560_11855 [Acidobacteriota bacterium]